MQKGNAVQVSFFKRGRVFQSAGGQLVLYLKDLPRSSRSKFKGGHEYRVTLIDGLNGEGNSIVVASRLGKVVVDTRGEKSESPSRHDEKPRTRKRHTRMTHTAVVAIAQTS